MPSAIGGLAGGLLGAAKSPSVPNLSTYQPTGLSEFDKTFQDYLKASMGNDPYKTYAPQAAATFNTQYNNPYAGGYQTAANTAGTAYGNVGANATGASDELFKAALAQLPGARQVLDMGFDPQSALKREFLQHSSDVANVNSATRGITNSPYGASVADTADRQANIDWQSAALDRAIKALSASGTAVSGAQNAATGAGALGTSGAAALNNAGAVPFNATNIIAGNQSDALNQLLQVLGNSGGGQFDQNMLNQLMSYLGLGTNQSNVQAGLNAQNYSNKSNAASSGAAGAGAIASSLASIFL